MEINITVVEKNFCNDLWSILQIINLNLKRADRILFYTSY